MHDARGRCGSMCVCVYVFLRPPPACGFICVLSFLCVVGVCVCVSEVKSTLDWLVVCGQILYLLVCIGT